MADTGVGQDVPSKVSSSQPPSEGLITDVLSGFGHAFEAHAQGAAQAFGAKPDLSYLKNEDTAQRVGHAIGEATLFIGGTLLASKIPFISRFAGGSWGSIGMGGLLGFSTPLAETQTGLNRLYNTGLGAGTMAMLEFAPGAIGNLPGVSSLAKDSLAASIARYGTTNALAGSVNTEGQSFINTGHAASATDLAISAGTWAALGTVANQAGVRFNNWRAGQAETKAAYAPENAPWQHKAVTDINAAQLQPGQKLVPGNYRVSFESQGAQRTANIYVSDKAAQSAKGAPLVTFLHGLNPNGAAEDIMPELDYYKYADRDGAVVAMLQGRNGLKGIGSFQSFHDTNFGYAKPGPGIAPYSDQVAFDDMMLIIRAHVPNTNTDNIAVSGFSLGAKMASRIAANRADVAAVASLQGTIDRLDEEVMNAATPRHPIDGIFVMGEKSRVLPLDGGKSLFTIGLDNNDLSRPLRQAEFWGESNGSSSPVTTDGGNYVRRDWQSGSGNRVTEYVVKNGEHALDGAVPRHNMIQWLMGRPKPANYFDARQRTWDFMIDSLQKKAGSAEQTTAAG